MKLYSTLLLSSLSFLLYGPTETTTNNFNIHVHNDQPPVTIVNTNAAEATSSAQAQQTQTTNIHTAILNAMPPLPNKTTILQWLAQNKLLLAGSSTLSLYCIVLTLYLRASRYIKYNAHWCHWKKNLTIHELQKYTYQELGKELIHAIQTIYFDPKHPTSFIIPCVQFIIALDNEEYYCNKLLGYYHWIHYCKLGRLFRISSENVASIEEYKQRLSFIRHLFISWVADNNIQQSMASNSIPLITNR